MSQSTFNSNSQREEIVAANLSKDKEALHVQVLYLYKLKIMKNTHGEVLILINMQTKVCKFTKSNISPWVFFIRFLDCKNDTKSRKVSHIPKNTSKRFSQSSSTRKILAKARKIFQANIYLFKFSNKNNRKRVKYIES